MKSEIGTLVLFFNRELKCSYEKKLGLGVFGRNLQTFLNETHVCDDLEPCGIPLNGKIYEEEYEFVK